MAHDPPDVLVKELRYWAGDGDTESQACMLRAAETLAWYAAENVRLTDDLAGAAKHAAYDASKRQHIKRKY